MTLWILTAVFVALSSPFMLIASRVFALDRAISQWPRARGIVTSSGVNSSSYTRQDPQTREMVSATGYEPVVRYTYTVGDQTFAGDRVERVGGMLDQHVAQACVDRYPTGREVDVLYDPANPKTAYLESHRSTGAVILFGFGCVFLLTATVLAIVAIFV